MRWDLKILWFLGLGTGSLLALGGLLLVGFSASLGGAEDATRFVFMFIVGMALIVTAIATARHVFPDRWP